MASGKDAPCDPAKSGTTRPLATASQRLRGRPGRPRTKPRGDNHGDSSEAQRTQVRVPPARPAARTQDSPSCAPPWSVEDASMPRAPGTSLGAAGHARITQDG